MRGHATIDNKYIKYGMLDNISLCGCPIPTPPVIAVVVALMRGGDEGTLSNCSIGCSTHGKNGFDDRRK